MRPEQWYIRRMAVREVTDDRAAGLLWAVVATYVFSSPEGSLMAP